MIEEILPAAVLVAEAFSDMPEAALFPEEEAAIARAVPRRRQEFSAGRACARAALARLGVPAGPIPQGQDRAPQWPAGVVGSITHCAGYRAAVVARSEKVASVGVDAEPHAVLPDGVLRMIATDQEEPWLRALAAARPDVHWDRFLFSAKESVYKAWYPLCGRWLGFQDAVITPEPDAGTFTAALLVPGPEVGGREVTGFSGRWLVRDGLILTAIAVLP